MPTSIATPSKPRVTTNLGIIVRLLPDGYGYVRTRDASSSEYVFSFGSIPNYRGETAKELGLHAGRAVEFDVEGEKIKRLALV